MDKQQASPTRAVLSAVLFVAVAAGAFAAAFYFFDGASVFASLANRFVSSDSPGTPPPDAQTGDQPADALSLPSGMPESFALRLWHEQVDSQSMIRRLVDGEIRRMTITDVKRTDDVSTLKVRVSLADGSAVSGRIVMRRFGDAWFVSSATAEERAGDTAESSLPKVADVDIALLNTVIAEQAAHTEATEEYATGQIFSVDVEKAEMGPNSARIPVIMNEDHEIATADLIAVKSEVQGRFVWFIARFEKTGSEPLKK